MARKISAEQFIEIGCPIHGYFETHPGNFINKSRNSDCPKCSQERLQKAQTSNKEKQLVSIIQKHYPNLSILENERFKISNQSNHKTLTSNTFQLCQFKEQTN